MSVDPLSFPVPSEAQLRKEEREDEWYAEEAAISASEQAHAYYCEPCALCDDVGIVKDATGERRFPGTQVWVSVCDAHAYRIDSVKRG